MSFDDVRLPEDVERGAKGGPGFNTSVIDLAGGDEQRVSNWQQGRAEWDIGYGIGGPDDWSVVESFFYSRRAKARGFRFKDFHDYKGTGESLGTGTGTLRTFLLVKHYGTFARRISRPVTGTVVVYVDGIEASPSTYDLFTAGGYVRFHAGQAPANTKPVTADFEFDVPVRFDIDKFDLTLYWEGAGEVPHLPIKEIRDDVNAAPTVALVNTVTSVNETQSMVSHLRVADVQITDDPFGLDELTLSGADASYFELAGTIDADGGGVSLYLKAGTSLDNTIKSSYAVTVNVLDPELSAAVQGSANLTVNIVLISQAPHVHLTNLNASLPWDQDTSAPIRVADIVVTQHGSLGTNVLSLSGTNAASFHITGSSLYTNIGISHAPDAVTPVTYSVAVDVSNASFASPPQDSAPLTVAFGVVGVVFIDDTPGTRSWTVPEYQTLVLEEWGGGAGSSGLNAVGHDGTASSIPAMGLVANPGKCTPLTVTLGTGVATVFDTEGGPGGTASGGDENTTGNPGGVGIYKRSPASVTAQSGAGGAAPGGGAGGAAASATLPTAPSPLSQPAPPADTTDKENHTAGSAGSAPGAGASGAVQMVWKLVLTLADGYTWTPYAIGRPGAGSGGKVKKTFVRGVTVGAPAVGASITYTVGSRGDKGQDVANGGNGAHGRFKATVT